MFYSLSAEWLQILNLVVVILIPTATAVLTKEMATSRVKSLTLVGLSALLAVVTGVLDDGGYTYLGLTQLFVQNVVFAVSVYYGVAKPNGLAGAGSPASKVPALIG